MTMTNRALPVRLSDDSSELSSEVVVGAIRSNETGSMSADSNEVCEERSRMLAWQYGLLEPLDWDADCEREIRLQNDLWNKLVEIQRAHRARLDQLYTEAAPVAEIETRLEALEDEIKAILAERKKQRQRARKRIATPELDRQLDERRVLRKEILPRLKEARAAVREARRDDLKRFADQRYQAITQARHESGLWWSNYNAVIAAFDVAARELGPGEEVRFHRFDGRGRLTNQIQHGITPETLLARGHSQIRLEPMPKGHPLLRRGAGKRGQLMLLTATIWSRGREGRKMCSWPILMHRPFPEGALVKTVTITRILTGRSRYRAPPASGEKNYRWLVSFACSLPAVAPAARPAAAGIDTGWRKLAGGGLRIATVVDGNGGIDHVILPQRWLERREWAAKVQSDADEAANAVLTELRAASLTNRAPPASGEFALGLPAPLAAQWEKMNRASPASGEQRSVSRPHSGEINELLRTWETQCRSWRPELRHRLDDWRSLRIEYSDLVDKLAKGRREIYRIAAKALAERYGVIAVDKIAVAQLGSRKEDKQADGMPPETRRMRSWSAPYDFVAELRRAAAARGVRVHDIAGPTTLTCHHCGHRQADRLAPQRAELFWRCSNCGHAWDQDENAARNVLAALLDQASGAAPIAPASGKIKAFQRARITRKRTPASAGARNPPDDSLESGGGYEKV